MQQMLLLETWSSRIYLMVRDKTSAHMALEYRVLCEPCLVHCSQILYLYTAVELSQIARGFGNSIFQKYFDRLRIVEQWLDEFMYRSGMSDG